MPSPPRSYYEAAAWQSSLESVELSPQAADDLLTAVTFEIARIPEEFPYIDADSSIQVAHYDGYPRLLVFFQQE